MNLLGGKPGGRLLLLSVALGIPVARIGIAVLSRAFDFALDRVATDLAVVFRGDRIAAAIKRGVEGDFVVLELGIFDFDVARFTTLAPGHGQRAGHFFAFGFQFETDLPRLAAAAGRSGPGPRSVDVCFLGVIGLGLSNRAQRKDRAGNDFDERG